MCRKTPLLPHSVSKMAARYGARRARTFPPGAARPSIGQETGLFFSSTDTNISAGTTRRRGKRTCDSKGGGGVPVPLPYLGPTLCLLTHPTAAPPPPPPP